MWLVEILGACGVRNLDYRGFLPDSEMCPPSIKTFVRGEITPHGGNLGYYSCGAMDGEIRVLCMEDREAWNGHRALDFLSVILSADREQERHCENGNNIRWVRSCEA